MDDFCIGLPSVCHNEICSTSGERSHRQIRVGLTKRYQIPIRPAERKDTKSRNGHPRPCFSTILKIGTASQADTCRPHEKIPNPGTACLRKDTKSWNDHPRQCFSTILRKRTWSSCVHSLSDASSLPPACLQPASSQAARKRYTSHISTLPEGPILKWTKSTNK